MKKRPLLILTGTVMGTVGVLSYVPIATNATSLGAISVSPSASPLATNTPANTKFTAKPTEKSTAKASGPVVATSKTLSRKAKSLKKKHKPASAIPFTPASTGSTSIRKIAGSTIQTQFGPVQVQITVQGTKIIAARALQTPHGGTSSMINQQAVPYLIQQTLAAQSAAVQGVSGATYTSDGWARSLQSAVSQI